jgi:hypothetical protein
MWQKTIFTKQLGFHSTNQPPSSSQKLTTAAPSNFMGPEDSFATFVTAATSLCSQLNNLVHTKYTNFHPVCRTRNLVLPFGISPGIPCDFYSCLRTKIW